MLLDYQFEQEIAKSITCKYLKSYSLGCGFLLWLESSFRVCRKQAIETTKLVVSL